MSLSPSPLPDIQGRAEIETLVNTFYERVRGDALLGFIFEEVAHTDWNAHLPRMYAFWETVLFRTGSFTGNPLAVHARLVPLTDMGKPQFERWLEIFCSTVDSLFAGERAEHIKNCARDMANVIHSRINGIPARLFDFVQPPETPVGAEPKTTRAEEQPAPFCRAGIHPETANTQPTSNLT